MFIKDKQIMRNFLMEKVFKQNSFKLISCIGSMTYDNGDIYDGDFVATNTKPYYKKEGTGILRL